jgi:hypothetical protein
VKWRIALNLVAFQAAWFACVMTAARGEPWVGIAAVAAAVLLHLAGSHKRRADLLLCGAALLIGVVWDSALAQSGWVAYASPAPGPLAGWAPPWILAMWVLFATTLREPLRWLHGRPALAAMFGGVGGPLSYAGAERLGACQLVQPLPALAALAVGWAVITPLLVELARRLDSADTGPSFSPKQSKVPAP